MDFVGTEKGYRYFLVYDNMPRGALFIFMTSHVAKRSKYFGLRTESRFSYQILGNEVSE